MKKFLLISLFFIVFGLITLFTKVSSASAASFYFFPSSASVEQGKTVDISVRVNTEGENVATIYFEVNFDPAKFELQSYDWAGSPFNNVPIYYSGTGQYSAAQFQAPPSPNTPPVGVSGDVFVGTLKFKALIGSSSVGVVYNNDSTEAYKAADGSALPTTTTNGTYNLISPPVVEPPVPPPPTGGGTSGGGSGTKNSGSTTTNTTTNTTTSTETKIEIPPTSDNQKPEISGIKVTANDDGTVLIEWQTDENSSSEVNYGEDISYSFGEADPKQTKAHSLLLKENLKPDTTYQFIVVSTDLAGNTAESDNQSFRTKPPVSVQRTYRYIGLAMIVGGLSALAIIAFYYFRKKGPHPDNLPQDGFGSGNGPKANLNPPI